MADESTTPDAVECQMMANNSAAAGMRPETVLAHLLKAGFDQETAMEMTKEAVKRAPAVKAYHEAHRRDANSDRWQDWLVIGGVVVFGAVVFYFFR